MTTMIRRTVTAAMAALLLSGAGAVTTLDAASAIDVSTGFGGLNVFLTEYETRSAAYSGEAETTAMCYAVFVAARSAGYSYSDWVVYNCGQALTVCSLDALSNNRTLAGVRFDDDSESYGCLIR